MGHLFTRMATVWLEEQKSSLPSPNNFTGFKSRSTKRKRTDHDEMVTKRKIPASSADKNDSDDDSERLLLSPRVPPIVMKSSNTKSRPMQSTNVFRCQLCRRCLRSRDSYMDHMMKCASQRRAAVKIVRADKGKNAAANL